jgi:hypothetical protein
MAFEVNAGYLAVNYFIIQIFKKVMKKKVYKLFVTLLALSVKGTVLMFFIMTGLNHYDPTKRCLSQNFLVWVLIYIPAFMGFERLISTIFKKEHK